MIEFELLTLADKEALENAKDFEDKSTDGCIKAVQENGFNIQFIENPSEKVIVEACKQNGLAIAFVDKDKQGASVFDDSLGDYVYAAVEACKQNGLAIKYIDERFVDTSVCLEAVKQNPNAFIYTDKDFSVCQYMIELDYKWFEFFPDNQKDMPRCQMVCQQNPKFLKYVPSRNQTLGNPDLPGPVRIAITQDRSTAKYIKDPFDYWDDVIDIIGTLRYSPNHIKQSVILMNKVLQKDGMELKYCIKYARYEQCKIAIQQNGLAIQFLDKAGRSDKILVRYALNQNGLAIQYINKSAFTISDWNFYCRNACNTTAAAYQFVYGKVLTKEEIKSVLRRDYTMAKYLEKESGKYNVSELYSYALQVSPKALEFVPKERQHRAMCLNAVKQDGSLYKYIKNNACKKDKDIIRTAVTNYGLSLKYVENPTYDNCVRACRQNGLALQFVPEKHIDRSIVSTAVNNTLEALKYVPEKYLPIIIMRGDDE